MTYKLVKIFNITEASNILSKIFHVKETFGRVKGNLLTRDKKIASQLLCNIGTFPLVKGNFLKGDFP